MKERCPRLPGEVYGIDMKRVIVAFSAVLVLIVIYTLCFGFGRSADDKQESLQVMAFADVQQLGEQHPKMHLIHQIDAEIQALSLWQMLLDNGLFVDIPNEYYEEGFAETLTSCGNLEGTIEALQVELGVTNGVEQMMYIETRIIEEARALVEEKRYALETLTMETIEAVEMQLLSEFSESMKRIRDEHRVRTFNIGLKLEFLNLSQEEKSALAYELHRIRRDTETKEENLRMEMTRALESFTQSAYASMVEGLQDVENAIQKRAREQYEVERGRIHGVTSLFGASRDVYTDTTSFVQNSTTLRVEVPQVGKFHFDQFRNNREPEFYRTIEWCEQEIERLLAEKGDLERSIMNEIKVVAMSVAQAQNMHLEFVNNDESICEGTDLSNQVLDMINTRYEWFKGES